MGLCVAKQNSLSSTQLAFPAKFPKNRRFRLPWSTIDLVNQRRRPTPTVAPREVKLRFWFFAAGCRFLLHNVTIFFGKPYRDMNRVNVFAIHRCINEGYGLIQIFTEKIRISPTKLWRVCWFSSRRQWYRSVTKCVPRKKNRVSASQVSSSFYPNSLFLG